MTPFRWVLVSSLRTDFTAIDIWWKWLLDSLFIFYKNFDFLKQIESTHVSPKQLWLLLKLVKRWSRITRRCSGRIPGRKSLIWAQVFYVSLVLLFKLFRRGSLSYPSYYLHSVLCFRGISLFWAQLRGTDLSLIEFNAWSFDFDLGLHHLYWIWYWYRLWVGDICISINNF